MIIPFEGFGEIVAKSFELISEVANLSEISKFEAFTAKKTLSIALIIMRASFVNETFVGTVKSYFPLFGTDSAKT